MRRLLMSLIFVLGFGAFGAKPARAYDMDCAIILCMAGGFPPSAVCSAAYAEMIRRITPWPVRPPFGICTYTTLPVEFGSVGDERDLDVARPEYAWLRRTRVYWFRASTEREDGDTFWSWSVRSCDHENQNCRYHVQVYGSRSAWPASFASENGQSILLPGRGVRYNFSRRAVMVEFGDYEGNMDHSEWFRY